MLDTSALIVSKLVAKPKISITVVQTLPLLCRVGGRDSIKLLLEKFPYNLSHSRYPQDLLEIIDNFKALIKFKQILMLPVGKSVWNYCTKIENFLCIPINS